MNFNAVLIFLKENIFFILIPLLFFILMLLKPFRKFMSYCAKNISALIFFISISFFCSLFGYTISLNIFSAASALFLGLPGISLALFLSLVI
ncbi:MAG: pro-sigmaK processing inhibitor BofA family protein [Oscillospiraceae bacterium]|nr:pro-sigmaK processing inhibitor BofA family protein [Oscillospiraceae bacterium]